MLLLFLFFFLDFSPLLLRDRAIDHGGLVSGTNKIGMDRGHHLNLFEDNSERSSAEIAALKKIGIKPAP